MDGYKIVKNEIWYIHIVFHFFVEKRKLLIYNIDIKSLYGERTWL